MTTPSIDLAERPKSHDDRTLSPSAQRAARAAFLGSMLEYYDFFLYGAAAALVFPVLFFPSGDPAVATIASLATFGVGYLARPLGGIVLGHFGDKVGRKKVLLFTLIVMGTASVGIGFIPSYDKIGIAAPILLVLARLAQGFSAGGEAAGASSLTIEHAPEGRRGFLASFMIAGVMAGIVLANLVFIPIATLPDSALFTWGWRVPFWASIIVLVIAYMVRRNLDETPIFSEIAEEDKTYTLPTKELLRTHWADVIRVAFAALFAVFQTVVMIYSISFATSPAVGMERSTALWVIVAAHAASVPGVIFMASLSDRVGRRPVWIIGAVTSCAMVFVYFASIAHGNLPTMFISGTILIGITYSGMNGLWPVLFSEQFAAPVRYSGFALGHGAGLVMAAFAPSISAGIAGPGINGWLPVALMTTVTGLTCATAVFFFRETAHVPLEELGNPKALSHL